MPKLVHDCNSPTRVELIVKPGDVLDVSDDVAAQLRRSSNHFKTVEDEPVKRGPGRPRKVVEDDTAEADDED